MQAVINLKGGFLISVDLTATRPSIPASEFLYVIQAISVYGLVSTKRNVINFLYNPAKGKKNQEKLATKPCEIMLHLEDLTQVPDLNIYELIYRLPGNVITLHVSSPGFLNIKSKALLGAQQIELSQEYPHIYALSQGLAHFNSWITLVLERQQINSEGAGYLASALEINQTLEGLYLGSNSIGTEGAMQLAGGLAANKSLQGVDLKSYVEEMQTQAVTEPSSSTFLPPDLNPGSRATLTSP